MARTNKSEPSKLRFGVGGERRVREARLQKLTETDDIEHFLTMFERVANAYKWPDDVWVSRLAPLLTGKA